MAFLRMLGSGTILENNVVQTIASAGQAVAAGAIFTFPALFVLGDRGGLPYWQVTLLCLAGAIMGSLLVVFLRRTYIIEEKLPFPEGRACAEVLRLGEPGGSSADLLALGGIAGALPKIAQDVLDFLPQALSGAGWFGRAAFAFSVNLSAALLGVGYIVGIEIAAVIFLGGVLG
jgi:putative OPT family oligopeptide transporter